MTTTQRMLTITRLTALFIVLAAFQNQPLQAQSASPTTTTSTALLPDEEALHQELRGLKKTYEDAVNSGDLSSLASCFGPQTSGVVATNEEFHTLAEMQQIFDNFKKTLGPGYVYRVTLNPEHSQIYGDIAVARGSSDEYVKTSNGEFKLLSRWTAVLRRENGQWHLIRSQVSLDPFHNPVNDYFFATVKKIYGGGGSVVGLVVGLMLGFILWGRRKTA